MKLTRKQKDQLDIALRESALVLNDLKGKRLKGEALEMFNILENAVLGIGLITSQPYWTNRRIK